MTEKIERTYVINLRHEIIKVPFTRKAKKAVKAVKEFIIKHMKTENVNIGNYLNEYLWSRGIKNPPAKVKVNVVKKDDVAYVELFGFEHEALKEKKEKKKKLFSKKQEDKKEETKKEVETKETKKETTKTESKDKETKVEEKK